ncbi:LysR family transcriptional regulator [Pseudoruegeria sp. SHC-113]|uniref:LysR family transcriptional regulator n=1 Tax=Pseudoruegeria sp. SHC-113 TaxID=2855439 RepID=UPI0021BAAA0F|nr:LysR family transcriptional regulator [Pseudoruegeria sp. SHC-113]MCT8159068.1 LysR family transcriptional regulator [Pseudoruegeria sp. SHC-113]
MDNWDEIRTAYQVARMGTVSGAADVLGVHHATVIRHIDALEAQLGAKLFQRHARGYTPTEAGRDLLQVAQATDDQFTQLESRIKGGEGDMRGELVVTALPNFTPLLAPVLAEFQIANPGLVVRLLTGLRLFRLEYGEAHVAIRAGSAPQEPDNVVQPFYKQDMGLYAHKSYMARAGEVSKEAPLDSHAFIGPDDPDSRAPFYQWMKEAIPRERVVFRLSGSEEVLDALRGGVAIGFLPVWQAVQEPDLVQVMPPRPEWSAASWIVTHVDLHRTPKVQAFLGLLKERSKAWPCATVEA